MQNGPFGAPSPRHAGGQAADQNGGDARVLLLWRGSAS
jgi:hypothetical protein